MHTPNSAHWAETAGDFKALNRRRCLKSGQQSEHSAVNITFTSKLGIRLEIWKLCLPPQKKLNDFPPPPGFAVSSEPNRMIDIFVRRFFPKVRKQQ